MINCIAVDKRKTSIAVIAEYIEKIPHLRLIETFDDTAKALNFLKNNIVHIVFTDVQTIHLTVFDFLSSLRSTKGINQPAFILTASDDKFAIKSFEQGVTDYLLKPICFNRFKLSIDRLINYMGNQTNVRYDFFFADANGRKMKIKYKDLIYVESSGNYVILVGFNFRTMIYKSMNKMLEILDKEQFIRIHKSYIVSIEHIDSIKGNECIMNIVGTKITIPIGSTFKESALKKLQITL
jgi:DNA-binding LytR/AlgR family response regulator